MLKSFLTSRSSAFRLIMVIRQVVYDCVRSVELFHEQQAYHLVREGHLRERQFLMRGVVNLGGKAVRAANNEYKAFGRYVLLVLDPCRELGGAVLLATLVKQHHAVAWLQ